MNVLVTGAAGFIGMHVARRLLEGGAAVVGVDDLDDYYDVALKQARLEQLERFDSFHFERLDLADAEAVERVFSDNAFDRAVNLAAQPGVRYSLENPHAYVGSNVVAFLNLLEGCRHHSVAHLVFASSSSVYGANTAMPFSVHDRVDHPVSLYAATKKANELMAHTYSHLYAIPTTGLRFFTVYGPWGRPDMAPTLFAKAIVEGRPIDVFNEGDMRRDFTYIDDAVDAVVRIIDTIPEPDPDFDHADPDPARSSAPYRLFNVGHHEPVGLLDFIAALESALGKAAEKNLLPMQPGDVAATYADIDDISRAVGFEPATPLDEGLAAFAAWFTDYYG